MYYYIVAKIYCIFVVIAHLRYMAHGLYGLYGFYTAFFCPIFQKNPCKTRLTRTIRVPTLYASIINFRYSVLRCLSHCL